MLRSIMNLHSRADRVGSERVAEIVMRAFQDGEEFTADRLMEILMKNRVFEQLDAGKALETTGKSIETGAFTFKQYQHRTYRALITLASIGYVDLLSANPKVYRANSALIAMEYDMDFQRTMSRIKEDMRAASNRYGSGTLRAALSGGFASEEAQPVTGNILPLNPNTRVKRGLEAFLKAEQKQK